MKLLHALLLLLLAGLPAAPAAWAAEEGEELDPVHHSVDGYYLDFEPIGKVELPRLFLVERADGSIGFDAFWGTSAAVASGRYVPEFEAHDGEEHAEDILQSNEDIEDEAAFPGPADEPVGTMLTTGEAGSIFDAHLVPAGGGHVILDFSITRHLVFAIIGALIVLLIFTTLAGRYKRGIGRETAPRGRFQNLFETLVIFVRDDIAKPNLGDKYPKFLPYLLTAFFFILTCNLLGLVPFGATATSNIMLTAVLATITFLLTQINASKDHWKHIFWPPGVPVLLKPILIPVEFLGLFTKPIALAIRLFANMTAGHLIILSLIGLIFSFGNLFGPAAGYGVSPVSVAFSLFIYLLELLVAFIQAYIFTMLSALFIGMAIEEHHGHEPGDGHLPELTGADHGHVTPHLITGNGAEEVTAASTVHRPATAPAI